MGMARRVLADSCHASLADRLFVPVQGLFEYAGAKGAAATLLTFVNLFTDFGRMLQPEQVNEAMLLSFVLLVDLLTGIYASWWRKTSELGRVARPKDFLSSIMLRQSLLKVGEYLTIMILVNAAANVWPTDMGWAKHWAFIYIFATELWSIAENMQHSPVRKMAQTISGVIQKANPAPETKESRDENEGCNP